MAKTCKSCGHSLLDFQRVCEKCGAIQPEAQQPVQEPQAPAPPQTLLEEAPPPKVRRAPPPPSPYANPPTGRKLKPLILASILVVVVVLAVVAVALIKFNPFASLNSGTNGSPCTMTTNVGGCQIGNNLRLLNLHVSNSSYSNHATYLIVFLINNTGTTPVNITAIKFDNEPVINGLPTPGSNATFPFWVTYLNGHVMDARAELQFGLDVPRPAGSGTHMVTLVDSAGNSYTFSFNL